MATCLTFSYVTCGSGCADPDPIYYHVFTENGKTIENCGVTDLDEQVIQTKLEYVEHSANSSIGEMYDTYFAFDPELFATLQGWMLLTFVVGFGVGKVIHTLNLSNR